MVRQRGLGYAAALTGAAILAVPYLRPQWLMGLVVILYALILFRFFDTKYLTYAICTLSALYGIGLLPPFVFASSLAMIVLGELVFQTGADDLNTYLYYIISTAWAGVLVMVYLGQEGPLAILTVIFGLIAAVLLKTILLKYEDSLMLEAVGIAMTMWLIQELKYEPDLQMVVAAVIIGFTFGYFAFRAKTADLSGLFSAALVGIILLVFAGPTWFLIMLAFFMMGSAATKYNYEYKMRIGVEQGQSGARGYRNVFANGIAAAAAAVLYGVFQDPVFVVMYVGCVATAAADTMASEIGVTGGIPYMITTLKRVPIGTNGGVTMKGELVALAGGVAIALIAYLLNAITLPMVIVCSLAGIVGTNLDSLVGATLENRGFLGNAGTNLLATIGGGLFAAAVYLALNLHP